MREGELITSRDNALFRRFRRALDRHDEEIVVEGRKQVEELLQRGWNPVVIAVEEEREPVSFSRMSVQFSRKLFRELTDTVHSQGVVGLFERPSLSLESLLDYRGAISVALDAVQDPGNVGTIIRLAAAFNCAGVVLLEGSADHLSSKTIRASSGAALTVPVCRATRSELIDAARSRKLPIWAAIGESGCFVDPPSVDAILVLGSEGEGVSEEIRSVAEPISIRTSGAVESLNVAMAAAILLSASFELRRT